MMSSFKFFYSNLIHGSCSYANRSLHPELVHTLGTIEISLTFVEILYRNMTQPIILNAAAYGGVWFRIIADLLSYFGYNNCHYFYIKASLIFNKIYVSIATFTAICGEIRETLKKVCVIGKLARKFRIARKLLCYLILKE